MEYIEIKVTQCKSHHNLQILHEAIKNGGKNFPIKYVRAIYCSFKICVGCAITSFEYVL